MCLQVTCQPSTVALNTPFFLNIHYNALFKRKVDIHVDLLNGNDNSWQAGDKITVSRREAPSRRRLCPAAERPSR